MNVHVADDVTSMGQAAAEAGAEVIRRVLAERGEASIIVATGTSQFATLKALTAAAGIDWMKVTGFHLDEYLGLTPEHPASFRGYLRERFVQHVPFKSFHEIRGEADEVPQLPQLPHDIMRAHSRGRDVGSVARRRLARGGICMCMWRAGAWHV